MSEKVELSEKLLAVDNNMKELWDALDETQQKALKGELFILNRYISSVSAPKNKWQKGRKPTREEQEHYVLAVNEFYNKNFFLLQNHPKLLWQLLCMCSYNGTNTYFHEWIGHKKKSLNDTTNKKLKFLSEVYPNKKEDELEVIASVTSDADFKELARKFGLDEPDIKKLLK